LLVETTLTVEELALAEKLFKAAKTVPENFEEAYDNDQIVQNITRVSFDKASLVRPSQEALDEINQSNNWNLKRTDNLEDTFSKALGLDYTTEYAAEHKEEMTSKKVLHRLLFEIGSNYSNAEIYGISTVRAVDGYTFQPKIGFKVRMKTNEYIPLSTAS
jgi:uncharacterized protein YwqG